MKLKLFTRQEMILAFLIGCVFVMFIHTAILPRDTKGETRVSSDVSNVYGEPARLKIPKLQVDSVIISLGLTSLGALDTPTDPRDAGWFASGPRPGEEGSAVIDGHFGWKDNVPAIFDNLSSLKIGDKVFVEDDRGVLLTFIVRELRTYGPSDDAYDVFNSDDGKSHLNLITCQGVWNKSKKSYSERLVVFTDKVE